MIFNKMFFDVWFYNEMDFIYMRVDGVEEGDNAGIISCHYM